MTTPTLTIDDISALRALAEKATPGPWEWWTSNSWRRLTSRAKGKHPRDGRSLSQDGGVLCPVAHPRDHHPDVDIREGDMAFIAAARDALPRALDTIEAQAATITERGAEIARLREENDAMRDAIATANNTWRHEFATEIDAASYKLFKRLSATSLCHPARAHVRAALAKEKTDG